MSPTITENVGVEAEIRKDDKAAKPLRETKMQKPEKDEHSKWLCLATLNSP